MATTMYDVRDAVHVERWPSERPLFVLAVLVSLPIWLLLIVSVVGLIYAVLIGLFLFMGQVLFIAHVRGSGVRIGPDQFPELDDAVKRLSARLGLERVPEAYVMQAGGTLNALATRFFRSEIVVLFSELLAACGDDVAARDMIIAHELGHLKAGHLRKRWLILPAYMIPFLGLPLSRAREYTCDRFGLAGAVDREGALRGLAILAAGGRLGPEVNLEALARQRASLETGWMTIGEWLSTHPPLAKRIAALEPALLTRASHSGSGKVRALAILAAAAVFFIGIPVTAAVSIPAYTAWLERAGLAQGSESEGIAQVEHDVARLMDFIDAQWGGTGTIPADDNELFERWLDVLPDEPLPMDPFDGAAYGYVHAGDSYFLWSSGPDGVPGTDDDLVYDSRDGTPGADGQ